MNIKIGDYVRIKEWIASDKWHRVVYIFDNNQHFKIEGYDGIFYELDKREVLPCGEEIAVRNNKNSNWTKAIFYDYKEGFEYPFNCIDGSFMDEFEEKKYITPLSWKYARPIPNPQIEITVKINGKESKLSDISEETLLKIREVN